MPAHPDTDSITTLSAHLDHLASLHAEAKDLMPYKVDECSFSQGCHADTCTLFPTNTPTARVAAAPSIRPFFTNPKNKYTRNFKGEFCRCERGKTYDPLTEAESMVECLGCEDWFHESCLNLQDPNNPTPPQETISSASSTSSNENESPLLPSSAYSHLICSSCTLSNPLLSRYAGTEGWMMIIPSPQAHERTVEWKDKWQVIGREEKSTGVLENPDEARQTGEKRKDTEVSDDTPTAKRTKLDLSDTTIATSATPTTSLATTSVCKAPTPNPTAQEIIAALRSSTSKTADSGSSSSSSSVGSRPIADLFLQEGAREAICSCPRCANEVEGLSFPLDEEEEYEPEMEDTPDPTEEELTDQALSVLPRSQAIEGLLKFNAMKDRLKEFLEPFRDGGKVVSAADIEEFMDSIKNPE
ncbi:hypothetical protein QFC21_000727 [Naganishia friedmannii]|uniref:Uncharacterized protein n=1 Tax=Naganishia friedmannii TaxID=89922 RepID=A0ACC2W865_9TREE|nr:hypothetical protein QFC21_000727 [Naganishia friedmannii]